MVYQRNTSEAVADTKTGFINTPPPQTPPSSLSFFVFVFMSGHI
jgi:hypothetical protein